jgi:hypothetical protein
MKLEGFTSNQEESKKEDQLEQTPKHLLEDNPWAEGGLDLYKEKNKDRPDRVEAVREAIYTMFDQEINNSVLFESKETGATFPWSVVRVGDLAKELYKKSHPDFDPEKLERLSEDHKSKKDFLVTSFLTTANGNIFTFADHVYHQVMMALPEAFRALDEGREPEEIEIYTLGSPTNEVGLMSPQFTEEANKDPFGAYGKLYAEFVREHGLSKTIGGKKTELTFSGISMGGSFATEAAKRLIEQRVVTQDRKENTEENLPYLRINMYTPAGLNNDSFLRHLQTVVGFIGEGTYQGLTNPVVRKVAPNEGKTVQRLNEIYIKKGIMPHMEPDQKAAKKKLLLGIIKQLVSGVPVDPTIKANEIIGLSDPLMYSRKRNKEAKRQKEKHGESLGAHTLPRTGENRRVFGIDMSHTIPFYRENELKRWDRVADILIEMQKKKE